MICVFDSSNTNFTGNGNVVLTPVECKHTQLAAGKYDLTLKHPIDSYGKWTHIVPEAIIRAPVPEETIETAVSGIEADLYRTNTTAPLRSGPSEPERITYSSWSYGNSYAVGAKVTYSGQNYKLNQALTGYEIYYTPAVCSKWVKIANYTTGSPVIMNLKSGTDLYYISTYSSSWYKMCTAYGLEGYVKASQITYIRHLTPSETKPRTIREQLFRIKTVTVESKEMMITATAEHVSYDLTGVLVEDARIYKKNPATALAWIENEFMIDYRGTIATNMTSSSDGTYTGEIKGKNATFALLDPDQGIVSTFGAMYRRDNWDVFVMRRTNTNRGFQLRYGKNMLGVNWSIKSDGLITRVVPVAKDSDGSDLYLSGTKWVDSSHISEYPQIRMEWMRVPGQVGKDDGTETETVWTAAALREEMARKANARFSVDKVDVPLHEITIDFEMMGDTVEYHQLKELERVLMYDTVIAIDERIQMSVSVEVTEIEFDCIREKITAIKLSNVAMYGRRTVSGFNVFNNSITRNKLTDGVEEEIVGTIQEDAVEEANAYTAGRISSLNTSLRNWTTDELSAQETTLKQYTDDAIDDEDTALKQYTTDACSTLETQLKLWAARTFEPKTQPQ